MGMQLGGAGLMGTCVAGPQEEDGMGGRGDNMPCPALGIRVRELIAGEVSRWRTSLHLQDVAHGI